MWKKGCKLSNDNGAVLLIFPLTFCRVKGLSPVNIPQIVYLNKSACNGDGVHLKWFPRPFVLSANCWAMAEVNSACVWFVGVGGVLQAVASCPGDRQHSVV